MGFERIRSIVEIKLKNGKTVRKEASTSRGTPERPLSVDELNTKFRECASGILTSDNIEKSIKTIWNIENEKSLEHLISILTF
jgi:2-methylcitrate dehydratase PrpD